MHDREKTREQLLAELEALRHSTERYHHFVAESPVGVLEIDCAGRAVFVNPAMTAMLGYAEQEMLGKPFWHFAFDDDDASLARHNLSERLFARSCRIDARFKHKNGDMVWTELITRPLFYAGRLTGVFAHVSDISAGKRTQMIHDARMRLMQFAADHSLDELLLATLDEAERLTGSPAGFYHFMMSDQKTIEIRAWSARTPDEMRRGLKPGEQQDLSRAEGWDDFVRERQPRIINEMKGPIRREGWPLEHGSFVRTVYTPIVRNGGIVAIFGLADKPTDYGDADVEVVTLLSDLSWDIVEQKRSMEALRASEEKFRIVADFTNDWEIWTHPDGHFLYNSPSCESVTGYTPGEFAELPDLVTAIAHPDDRELYVAHVQRYLPSPDEGHIEYRIVTKSGAVRWISHRCQNVQDAHGRQLGRRISNRDVTRRRRAEEGTRASKELYRTLFEKNLDPIGIVESNPARLRFCNSAYARLFGYGEGETMAPGTGTFWAHIHPDDHARVKAAHAERLKGPGSTSRYEARVVRRDGTIRWVDVSATVIEFKGRLANLVILHDTTEVRREEQFRQDVEQIIRHDIKSPLFGIFSLAQSAVRKESRLDAAELFPQIVRGIQQVVHLLDASDHIRRMEKGGYVPNRRPVDLLRILHSVADSLSPLAALGRVDIAISAADMGMDSDMNSQPSLGIVHGESFLIEDMLMNLLKNAVEASPLGESVRVALRSEPESVRIDIHNAGVIPETVREKFFEKFASAGKPGGMGLGTYSALLIAKAHGGAIEFNTSDAGGTTIAVVIPRKLDDVP